MFNTTTLNQALPIAQSVESRGRRLSPRTPAMNQTVDTALGSIRNWLADTSGITLESMIDTMTNEKISDEQIVEHNEMTLGALTKEITAVVSTNVLLLRDFAIPLIDRIYCKVCEDMDEYQRGLMRGINVQVKVNPLYHILEDATIAGMVSRGKPENEARNIDQQIRVLPPLDIAQIKSLLSSPHPQLAELVEGWLTKIPDGRIEACFYSTFVHPEKAGLASAWDGPKEAGDVPELFIKWLVAGNLARGKIPDGVNLNLEEAQSVFGLYNLAMQSRMAIAIRQHNYKISSKALVLNVYNDNNGKVIEVLESTYNQLLEEGVPIEAIIGLHLENQVTLFYRNIIDNIERGVSYFNQQQEQQNRRTNTTSRDILRRNITNEVNALLRNNNGEITVGDVTLTLKGDVNTLIQGVNDYCANLDPKDNAGMLQVIQGVVSGVVLRDTMVEIIMNRMSIMTKANPRASINYIGLLATITVIVDALTGQCDVTTR